MAVAEEALKNVTPVLSEGIPAVAAPTEYPLARVTVEVDKLISLTLAKSVVPDPDLKALDTSETPLWILIQRFGLPLYEELINLSNHSKLGALVSMSPELISSEVASSEKGVPILVIEPE